MIDHITIIKPLIGFGIAGTAAVVAQIDSFSPLADKGLSGLVILGLGYAVIALWRMNNALRKKDEEREKRLLQLLEKKLFDKIHLEFELLEKKLDRQCETQPIRPAPKPVESNGFSTLSQQIAELEKKLDNLNP